MANRRLGDGVVRAAPWIFIACWVAVIIADSVSFLTTGTLEQPLFNATVGEVVCTGLYLWVRQNVK